VIITLTGNLLAERTFEFRDWEPGKTQRAARESFQVGGKGVNVSRMLARLGARTLALCFAGGATGDECLRWLDAHGVAHHAFRGRMPTRAGLVVRTTGAGASRPETTFLGPDVAPDAASLAACAAWLDAQPAAHALAFCGSFPGWETPAAAPLRDAIERRIAHAAAGVGNVHVDTYGAPLEWFVEKPVALVKINRAEFDRLAPVPAPASAPENSMPARLAAARRRWPAVRNWVITDGPRPIWCAAGAAHDDAPFSLQPPAIRENSPTGAGDVLFACILHALINRRLALAGAVAEAMPYAAEWCEAQPAGPGMR